MQALLPAFADNMVAYLEAVLTQRAPSRDHLHLLAGSVASCILVDSNSHVMSLYLRAVARHLGAGMPVVGEAPGTVSLPGSTSTARSGANVAASAASRKPSMQQQMKEILAATGHAVTVCSSPRLLIPQSGILPVLAQLVPSSSSPSSTATSAAATAVEANTNTSINNNLRSPPLTLAQVEFLQACIYAEQYRYAERRVLGTWPRPQWTMPASSDNNNNNNIINSNNTKTVGGGGGLATIKHVLRYYYLRGTIHLHCRHWNWAIRCFWTCLSIPTEHVSAIAIAAWKKLVLVQCIVLSDQWTWDLKGALATLTVATSSAMQPSSTISVQSSASTSMLGPFALPKAVPICVTRFFSSALGSNASALQVGSAFGQADHPEAMHIVEMEQDFAEQQQHQQDPGAVVNEGSNRPGNLGVRYYVDLVIAFGQVDRLRFAKMRNEHEALFQADGNMGLVLLCEAELLRRKIFQISRWYAVISIQHLSELLHLAPNAVQDLLVQLSLDRIWAIDVRNGYVYFPRLPPPTAAEDDTNNVQELMEMSQLVQQLDISIMSSPKYQSFLRKQTPSGADLIRGGFGGGLPRGVEDV